MCGITGWVSRATERPDEALLHRMCDAIHHRGPDSEGIFIGDQVALGARRLSIIDLETGDQPVRSQDGGVTIVFNGEIYNFREIRAELESLGYIFHTQGDTEVVVQSYLAWGERFLDRLNGMFALAIWDEPRQRLILARDRLGKKPLLVCQSGDALIFGSEFRAVLEHPAVRRDIDALAIDDYLTLGYVPAPRTAFQHIRKLPPGRMLIWERGETRLRSYWTLEFEPKLEITESEAIQRFDDLFQDAVRLRLVSDVPLGAFLSGGIDSAAVVAAMAEAGHERVKTFSIGFTDPAYNELPLARLVAERYGTDHHEFVVEPRATELLPYLVQHYGEPYADSSALPTFELARVTRKHVTVALNGDGGDEMFGGYDRYRALMLAQAARAVLPIPPAAYGFMAGMLPEAAGLRTFTGRARRFLGGVATDPGEQYARWMGVFSDEQKTLVYGDSYKELIANNRAAARLSAPFDEPTALSLADVAMRLDVATYLPGDCLVKVDIATMAHSLEGRSPFLDYRIAEFAARLPTHLKIRRGRSKYLLKRAMQSRIPAVILNRKKSGFGVPLARWFREDLRPVVQEVVLSDRALGRGYFEPTAIKRMVDDHVESRADHAPRLWSLLVLELWHQAFIDQSGSHEAACVVAA
jgi:asparagine synthase (glutamine-hydrolysing)